MKKQYITLSKHNKHVALLALNPKDCRMRVSSILV